MKDLEAAAQELAELCGRAWADCGAYERQDYIDEAQRVSEADELTNCIWRDAEYPFCETY